MQIWMFVQLAAQSNSAKHLETHSGKPVGIVDTQPLEKSQAELIHEAVTGKLVGDFLKEYEADSTTKDEDKRPFILNTYTIHQNQENERVSHHSQSQIKAVPLELSRKFLQFLQKKGINTTNKHQAFYYEPQESLYYMFYAQTQAVATDEEAYAILFYFHEEDPVANEEVTLQYHSYMEAQDKCYDRLKKEHRDEELVQYSKVKEAVKSKEKGVKPIEQLIEYLNGGNDKKDCTWTTIDTKGGQEDKDMKYKDFEKKVNEHVAEKNKHI